MSVAHVTNKGHTDVPGLSLALVKAWGLVDVCRQHKAGPAPPLGSLGELDLDLVVWLWNS